MVLYCRDCAVRDSWAESCQPMEGTLKRGFLTDLALGIIIGFITASIIWGVIFGLVSMNNRNKEIIEYAEKQIEIEALRENYGHRDPVEFLGDIPGVRGASDGASAEFDRKRNEALQRFRSGYFDR